MHVQEPALAPVTPGAGQAHNERFGKTYFSAGPLPEIRSPLQDALDDAAAAGMQAMLPAEERAAPAQLVPVQPPLMQQLLVPGLDVSARKPAAAPEGLALAVPATSEEPQSVSQKSSEAPVGQGAAEHAGQKEHGDVDMEGTSGNREAPAEVREGYNDEASHHNSQGIDAQRHITIEGQLEATAAAMEPDLVPDDDLPLTSLFGTAEAAALEQHSARSADRPEASQRPSTEPASLQPASQDSNQENHLPPPDDALQRYVRFPQTYCSLRSEYVSLSASATIGNPTCTSVAVHS